MKRSTIALVGALAVGLIGGGTAYALTTTGQEPAAIETTATPTAGAPTGDAPTDAASPEAEASTEPTPDYITASDDEGFLAEVERRMIPGSILDQFTDAELIAMGHDACAQLEDGANFEDVRAVEGEEPYENGAYYETSAIMNSAILAYCPDQM